MKTRRAFISALLGVPAAVIAGAEERPPICLKPREAGGRTATGARLKNYLSDEHAQDYFAAFEGNTETAYIVRLEFDNYRHKIQF